MLGSGEQCQLSGQGGSHTPSCCSGERKAFHSLIHSFSDGQTAERTVVLCGRACYSLYTLYMWMYGRVLFTPHVFRFLSHYGQSVHN